MRYELINQAAQRYQASLKATDSRLRNSVTLIHEDGSYFLWRNAFYIIVSDNQDLDEKYCCVFTEHYGHHVFSTDDIYSVDMLLSSAEPETNLKFDDFLKSLPSLMDNQYFDELKEAFIMRYRVSYDEKDVPQYVHIAQCGHKNSYFSFPRPLKLLIKSNSDPDKPIALVWAEGDICGLGKDLEDALGDFKDEFYFTWSRYVNCEGSNLNGYEIEFRQLLIDTAVPSF